MPTRTLRNEYALAASAQAVFAHVRLPQSYVGLSPLVSEVSDVAEIEGGFRYRAIERVPVVGSWRIDNPLSVTLLGERAGDGSFAVHGEVESAGGVHVAYRYDIRADGEGCRVVDVMTLRTPFGISRFAAKRARAVQLGRPTVLAARLASDRV